MHRVVAVNASADMAGLYAHVAEVGDERSGDERYYAEDGRAASWWRTSEGHEIPGDVTGEQFAQALAGFHPTTGEDLKAKKGRTPTNVAWAGFFAAPPEITLLAEHGHQLLVEGEGRSVAAIAQEVHDDAVNAAMDAAGDMWRVRRTEVDGHAQRLEPVAQWHAMMWSHHTQRDEWLHTHTHYVLPAWVQGHDGRWSTVDSRGVTKTQKLIGAVYQQKVRELSAERLGLEWDLDSLENGIAPALGRNETYIDARSSRSKAIAAYIEEHGDRLRQMVNPETGKPYGERAILHYAEKATQERKDTEESIENLVDHERAKLASIGVDVDQAIQSLLGPELMHSIASPSIDEPETINLTSLEDELDDLLSTSSPLTSTAVQFTQIDALTELVGRRNGLDGALTVWDRLKPNLVAVSAPTDQSDSPYAHYWTTPAALLIQDRLLTSWANQSPSPLITSQASIDAGLEALKANGITLDDAQLDAYHAAVRGSGGIIIEGGPGSGKTTTTAGLVAAWRHQTREPVRGLAVARQAAALLRDDAGLGDNEWNSIAGMVNRIDNHGPQVMAGLTIIDEASMVSIADLDKLTYAATQVGGRILMLGDPHQAPAITPGGAFSAIIGVHEGAAISDARLAAGTYTCIDRNVRQRSEAERARVDLMRSGHAYPALQEWQNDDALHMHDTTEAAITAAVHTALPRIINNEEVVLLSETRAAVDQINESVRSALVDAGLLDPGTVIGSTMYAPNQPVVLRHNDHDLKVRNGQRGTVVNVDVDAQQMLVRLDGQTRRLPFSYVANHVQHGWASTIHVAQGRTVDHAVWVPTATTHELAVVATSRHRDTLTIHAPAPDEDRSTLHHLPATSDPLESLAQRASTISADTLAELDHDTDRTTDAVERPRTTPRLVDLVRQTDDEPGLGF